MSTGETPITLVGNLTDDPSLNFSQQGVAVASFTIASSRRVRDQATGEWSDGDTLFLRCSAFRKLAENCVESLTRGMRVIVQGRLKQRSYETKEGEKRTVYEIEATTSAPPSRTPQPRSPRPPGSNKRRSPPTARRSRP